ncbi:MAG TPA: 50S ribosomal protein L9 [Planctomycetota bacterium]|jgi:large subunit ribosomal protein L9|nr:50S ribosomal protein L9 [Planctomycetota bacterium]
MELILLETVEGLGRPGDQVKVRPGYARNFLLPTHKAVPVSADVLRNLSKLKAKAEAEERAMVSTMEELAKRISGFQVQIPARATEEGHLFGSVTDKDVHAALGAAGWTLPLRAVRLAAHLKDAGIAEVPLHLHGEITATIKVEVLPVDAEGNRITVVAPAPEPAPAPAADEAEDEEASARPE